jgi:hypothetical protein
MATYDSGELFEWACGEYEGIKDMLVVMTNVHNKVSGTMASYDSVLKDFDILLEGILLSVSFVNGRFDWIESTFINKLTDHADIMEHLHESGYELTWEMMQKVSCEYYSKISAAIISHVKNTVYSELVSVIGVAAAHIENDVIDALKKYLLNVACALVFVDGDDQESREASEEYKVANEFVSAVISMCEECRDAEYREIEEYNMR